MDHSGVRLSPWTGEFQDPAVEDAYQAEAWPRLCHSLRLIALIAAALYLAMLYLNWKGFGDNAAFRTMAVLRLGTAFALLGMALASRPTWPRWRVEGFFVLTVVCMTATRLIEDHLAAEQVRQGGPALAQTFPVMPMIIFTVMAIPMRLVLLWSGVGALLMIQAHARATGLASPLMALTLFNLVFALGVGYGLRLALNRITRRDFLLRQDLERAEAEARRASEAKGRFLAVMSHEIRTPLNGVLGGVQLLEETALTPEQRQPLDVVARNGEQLALLLDEVLDLARIEAGRLELVREPFAPAELLAGVHAALYTQARTKGLALELAHGPLPPWLTGDVLRLRQVLINLGGNAVKFTPAGSVTLRLEVAEAGPGACRCTFEVTDTGPGLDAEAQARVFQPFEQGDMSLHRRYGGVGLGLAISRELVAAMGSELRLESAPGEGCTFRFTVDLPTAEAPVPSGLTPLGPALVVLVVDDVEANRIVAEGLLRSLGHRPQGAASGREALELLAHTAFDVLLVDLHMPDMDGLELYQRLRGLEATGARTVPVILVSADTERTRVEACLRAGMAGILAKPLRKARLAALLAGVTTPRAPEPALEPPLVDRGQVAQVLTDLGAATWGEALVACRASAEACLEGLATNTDAPRLLHRLAGLAATYAMPRLHEAVRAAEAQAREGGAVPLAALQDLTVQSLEALEAASR